VSCLQKRFVARIGLAIRRQRSFLQNTNHHFRSEQPSDILFSFESIHVGWFLVSDSKENYHDDYRIFKECQTARTRRRIPNSSDTASRGPGSRCNSIGIESNGRILALDDDSAIEPQRVNLIAFKPFFERKKEALVPWRVLFNRMLHAWGGILEFLFLRIR
jgi:hypothetical protein